MLKILHVIPAIAPVYGGPSTVILEMCSALRDNNVSVEIVSTDSNGHDQPLLRSDLPSNLNITLLRKSFSESFQYCFEFKKWLKGNINRFNLVHSHCMWAYLSGAACNVAFEKRIPFILRPAGMLSPYSLQKKSILKQIYWLLVEKKMIHKVTSFHATSEGEAKEIKDIVNGANVSVIPHGLPCEAYRTPFNPNWLRAKCPRSGGKQIILYFSRLHPKKGLNDILLPAFKALGDSAHLVIAGGEDSHSPGFEKKLKLQVQNMGLSENVTFLGHVSPNDRWKVYDGASVFVLPSQGENFGVVVAEAMARGTPVLVSDQVQIGNIVVENSGGFVLPLLVQEWVIGLRKILETNWERVPRYHGDWNSIAKKLIFFYEQILKNSQKV